MNELDLGGLNGLSFDHQSSETDHDKSLSIQPFELDVLPGLNSDEVS